MPRSPAASALLVVAACATPPKPRELEAYETLRKQTPTCQEAAKRSPDLVAAPRSSATKPSEEWQSNDLEESRRDALMAQIKLKTAIALYEQDQLKAKIQTLSAQQAQARGGVRRPAKDLASENEKLTLSQKYVEARKAADADKQRLSQQMTASSRRRRPSSSG